MLVLSRKNQESVVVGGPDGSALLLTVTVIRIQGRRVKLGFKAAGDVRIWRSEQQQLMHANDQAANRPAINDVVVNEAVAKWDDDGGAACLGSQ